MKKLYLLIFALFFLFKPPLQAQSSLGFYFNGAAPLKQLCDSGYRNGYGFSAEFLSGSLIKVPKQRFEIKLGFGFEYFNYGSAKVERLVFNTPNNDLGKTYMKNRMIAGVLSSKFIFNMGRVSPYFDVFVAWRNFYSRQVNSFYTPVEGYESSTKNTLFKTLLPHYGYSVGLLYRMGKRSYFDMRVSYSKGEAFDFVKLASVQRDPDFESNLKYNKVSSPVSDIITFRVGFVFKFKECNCGVYENGGYTFYDSVPRPRRAKGHTPNSTPSESTEPVEYNNGGGGGGKPAEVKPVPNPTPPKPEN